jgi:hypothetical protein
MEDMEPELLECAEDTCEVCGAHVGYGVRLFHLGRCDAHSDEEEPSVIDAEEPSAINVNHLL